MPAHVWTEEMKAKLSKKMKAVHAAKRKGAGKSTATKKTAKKAKKTTRKAA